MRAEAIANRRNRLRTRSTVVELAQFVIPGVNGASLSGLHGLRLGYPVQEAVHVLRGDLCRVGGGETVEGEVGG